MIQARIDVGTCQHSRTERVENYGGETIAWRCVSCTLITAHHGRCDNCRAEDIKLPQFARKMRFCSEDCQERHNSRVAKERAAAKKAAAV